MGPEEIVIILSAISRWIELQISQKHKANKTKEKNKAKAIDAVHIAVNSTTAYEYDRKNGSRRNRTREQEISNYWRKAARNVYKVDRRFSSLLTMKAQAWADPELWKDPKYKDAHLKIDTIKKQLEWLQNNE